MVGSSVHLSASLGLDTLGNNNKVLWAGASEHVKVYVRIRPPNERELASEGYTGSSQGTQNSSTVSVVQPNHVVIGAGSKSDSFTYDCVGGEFTTQEQVFNDVGKTLVEQCVKGYNGTIFAYGQTGSGKTYTMQGPSNMTNVGNHKDRGIIPRCLEYLFELIAKEEQLVSSVKYLCKASYIEIYNENIYDLLDNSTTARATREDIKRGVYVDGVTEESIHNPEDAYRLFEQGAANRHISATAMNRESSRSHSVLTLTIQSMALIDGINHIRESRFNLVDLAGSERQKLANTEGMRLKEAGNINKSLLCLGSVINALGEIASGHSRHVHYRDSRLTFLLKDSLGGNSNTFIVANVSPSALCYQESLSTLRFAQRAKMIRNKAVVNEDIQGNVNELRAEIQRLKAELTMKPLSDGPEDASVTHRLLFETLSKLRTEQEEHLAMEQKGFMLDDACKAREKQIQSAQLIIKFKESALTSYRKGATNAALEAEKGALQEEITQLRRQLDFHPEVLKIKAENLSLREMLQKYERYQTGLEEMEERQKKDKEYLYNLAGKLVEVEQENEGLRIKLGSATPKRMADVEEVDFPRIEGIEDILQESPPKIRDADRRFSSDMKSLLQRVTKSRQAEYRRLSGNNFGVADPQQVTEDARTPVSGNSTPVRSREQDAIASGDRVGASPEGTNLSNRISAQSNMRSDDTVEMTLLKRDVDRLKDENSVLVDEKVSLEKDLADAQFQLFNMEKYLEQATHQAEQLGRDLQSSRQSLSAMDQEAARKIMNLNREMQEQVGLMEEMRQASEKLEGELQRLRVSHHEVDQQLKTTMKELDDSRHRLVENQKEYDHQVEYNMRRINEFQGKETKWDQAKTELLKVKEELERQLEQERSRVSSTKSELEKEHRKLSEDCEQLMVQKTRLEERQASLEKELKAMRKASDEGAEEQQSRLRQQTEQYEAALKAEQSQKETLETELKTVQESFDTLRLEFEVANKTLETKMQNINATLQEREKQLEQQINALEDKRVEDLQEYESKARLESEESLRTLRESLLEVHEKEIQVFKSEAEEQTRALEEVKDSLKEAIDRAEQTLKIRQQIDEELEKVKDKYQAMSSNFERLKQEKSYLESQIEAMISKCQALEASLDEQRQEQIKLNLQLQQERLEKERQESTRSELRDKVSDMARKIGETEQKLEQARDSNRSLEMEYRTIQDELEHQLSKARNELAVKTSENMLNEEYKRKFRELRAQFADLGPTITERQQQGFHERELKRTMELERVREEMSLVQTRSVQLEANLALAQEMNEQLLDDAKANTAKIAEEMEKRLKEVEVQRQSAEREVELALETVQQKTAELQALQEQTMHQKEKIRTLEEELNDERTKIERLEDVLNEGKALQEEQEATEKELLKQETRQKMKEEQLMAQRHLLIKMKEEQQTLVKQQLERRDKTRALFEGLATKNGKLMEQVRDLGMVNESMMRHQNPKQKLQYHVKIKQENNELRIENQRLMFKAIELEERLGNKENVESLRKQVREMHGTTISPYQSSLESGIEADSMGMEMVKGLHDEMPIQRSPSRSPTLSAEPSGTIVLAANDLKEDQVRPVAQARKQTPVAAVGQKRKAAVNESSTAAVLSSSRKRPVASNQRTVPSTSATASTSGADIPGDIPLGPRARAKAAADAALAAAKYGRKPSVPTTVRQSTPSHGGASSSRPAPPKPTSRVTKASAPSFQTPNQNNLLRGARSGGAIAKPSSSGSRATGGGGGTPVIGNASAQRALVREARLAAAIMATRGFEAQMLGRTKARGGHQGSSRASPAPAPTLAPVSLHSTSSMDETTSPRTSPSPVSSTKTTTQAEEKSSVAEAASADATPA
ncbi:Kinesin-like protein kif15 [Mortierella claussenii]|nr:Kinesin-like protein kif15 [Mortierella claussenii]